MTHPKGGKHTLFKYQLGAVILSALVSKTSLRIKLLFQSLNPPEKAQPSQNAPELSAESCPFQQRRYTLKLRINLKSVNVRDDFLIVAAWDTKEEIQELIGQQSTFFIKKNVEESQSIEIKHQCLLENTVWLFRLTLSRIKPRKLRRLLTLRLGPTEDSIRGKHINCPGIYKIHLWLCFFYVNYAKIPWAKDGVVPGHFAEKIPRPH